MNKPVAIAERIPAVEATRTVKPIVSEKVSACFLCAAYCGVILSLDEDERVVKVVGDKNNPHSEGFICNKGVNLYTLLDSPERLTQPLKRVDGELVEISWEQALNEIAAKLQQLRSANGARSIGFAFGGAEAQTPDKLLGTLMINGLGSLNGFNPAGLEFLARYLVSQKMYGATVMDGHPDFDNAHYIVIIGGNPLVSCPPEGIALKAAAKDPQRTLVVIDPRCSETAKIADKHLAIKLSTDVYFLLAMLHVIVNEKLYDLAHVAKHSHGLESVAAAIADFTPQVAEQHTGIQAAEIYEVARAFAQAPAAVLYYHMGVIANHHATLVTWLIQSIKFITNNKGRKGGSLINPLLIDHNKLYRLNKYAPVYHSRTRPHLRHIAGCLPTTILADEILTPGDGQIRAMIVSCCNPLQGYGDSHKMHRAFSDLELLVSVDPFLTEVGRMADYVLPNCAFQEQENIAFPHPWLFKTPFLQLLQPIRKPRGNSWPEWKIFREILKRTGPQGFVNRLMSGVFSAFEWWASVRGRPAGFNQQRALLRALAWLGDVSWEELMRKPHGFNIQRKKPYDYLEHLETPDKKVHLAIPEFLDALQLLPRQPEPVNPEFPFKLSTICRSKANTNTMFHNHAWQRKNPRENDLKIHPVDAAHYNIIDSCRVSLVTQTASADVTVHISADVLPGTLHLAHGWGLQSRSQREQQAVNGVAAGQFSSHQHIDELTGMPVLSGIPCRIEQCRQLD